MSELIRQIGWQFLIFRRNNLLNMIIGITAFYMIAIYFIREIGNIEKFITLLIVSDPSMIAFMFVGLSIILDKDQEVLDALFVAPINHHFYLISRIFVLSATCLFCSLGMVLIAKGITINFVHFSVGVLSTSIIFSLIGIFVVSYTTEILHFIIRSVPLLLFMSLPIFNYFEITDIALLKVFPVQGSLYLIANSYQSAPDNFELVFGYIGVLFWVPVLYWFVFRTFKANVIYT